MTDPKYLINIIDNGCNQVLNVQKLGYENISSKETETQICKMSVRDEMKNCFESKIEQMKKASILAHDNFRNDVIQGIDESPNVEIIKKEIITHFFKKADQTSSLMKKADENMKKGITLGSLAARIAEATKAEATAIIAGATVLSAGILTFDATVVGLAFFGPIGLAAAGCISIFAGLISIFR